MELKLQRGLQSRLIGAPSTEKNWPSKQFARNRSFHFYHSSKEIDRALSLKESNAQTLLPSSLCLIAVPISISRYGVWQFDRPMM
uniref:CSON000737 protein n=1 Tax=Culicoides sonorensis TaxID=179676 RepID=A0A336LQU6_CULSO